MQQKLPIRKCVPAFNALLSVLPVNLVNLCLINTFMIYINMRTVVLSQQLPFKVLQHQDTTDNATAESPVDFTFICADSS